MFTTAIPPTIQLDLDSDPINIRFSRYGASLRSGAYIQVDELLRRKNCTETPVEVDLSDVELRNLGGVDSPRGDWHGNFPATIMGAPRESIDSEDDIVSDGSGSPVKGQKKRKTHRFALAFFALATVAFISSLDATSLSVALPVCRT